MELLVEGVNFYFEPKLQIGRSYPDNVWGQGPGTEPNLTLLDPLKVIRISQDNHIMSTQDVIVQVTTLKAH